MTRNAPREADTFVHSVCRNRPCQTVHSSPGCLQTNPTTTVSACDREWARVEWNHPKGRAFFGRFPDAVVRHSSGYKHTSGSPAGHSHRNRHMDDNTRSAFPIRMFSSTENFCLSTERHANSVNRVRCRGPSSTKGRSSPGPSNCCSPSLIKADGL